MRVRVRVRVCVCAFKLLIQDSTFCNLTFKLVTYLSGVHWGLVEFHLYLLPTMYVFYEGWV